MAKKSLLQEAIAEAKEIRETAIQNAYKALEENITPSIKEMLASKLEEEIDLNEDENEEESMNEDINAGFKKVAEPKKQVKEAEEEEPAEDDAEGAPETEEPDGDENGSEAEGDHEEPDGDEPAEEPEGEEEGIGEPSDDTKIEDLTLGDLRGLISDLVSQISATPAPEGDMGADMEPGDVDGMGDEEAPLEGEPTETDPAAETGAEMPADGEEGEDEDDEIDLSELLRELEDEESKDPRGKYHRGGVGNQDHELNEGEKDPGKGKKFVKLSECEKEKDPGKGKKFKKIDECEKDPGKGKKFEKIQEELDEAYETIKQLKATLQETNLLNSKLLYTTRMFNESNLSESQKARVIKSFDSAKSPKEVKLVYQTLNENMGGKSPKITLREHKSIASRSAGRSTAAPKMIVESNDMVRRFQQLAGIID